MLWFSGESMLSIFRIEDEETASVLLRAISCGGALADAVQSLELHDATLQIRTVIGVGGADKEMSKEDSSIFSGFLGGHLQR
jgi:hypothetical protein